MKSLANLSDAEKCDALVALSQECESPVTAEEIRATSAREISEDHLEGVAGGLNFRFDEARERLSERRRLAERQPE